MAVNPTKRIDLRAKFDEIKERYQARRESFNALVMGDAGSGKTYSLLTARKPVLIYQFDPGGSVGLREAIDKGDIFVIDYSGEDPGNPSAFRNWERDFLSHQRDGLLEQVGTVALDSLTSWSRSLMLAILHKNGRGAKTGGVNLSHGRGQVVAIPEMRDYQLQMATVGQYMGLMTGIAPDFICIAHMEYDRNDDGRTIGAFPLITGKLRTELPMLFDEIYIADPKKSSQGPVWEFITGPTGIYQGRTRIGSGGKLDIREPADFKLILSKCGRDASDLELDEAEA